MKQHLPRFVLGVLILVVLLGHAAKVYQLGFINHLDSIIYDNKVRLTMPRGIDERIVILDIDEKALGEIGRWPWGRDKLATLVKKLFDTYGASLMGFDVVFAEPDDSSGLKSLNALAGAELKDSGAFQAALKDLRPQLDFDARFAESLKGRPVVLGYYLSNKREGTSSGALPEPVLPAGSFGGRNIAFTSWMSYGGNLAEFQQAAFGGGHFNPVVDFDGVSRRVPLVAEYKGAYYESLSLAADVLRDRVKPDELRGKIVLVGTTAPGLMDLRATPVGSTYAGVEIHANLIAGFLDGSIKHKPSYVLGADVVLTLIIGGVMVFLMPLLSPLRASVATLVVLAAALGVNLAFWQFAHLVVPLAGGLILIVVLYAMNMSWGYFVESKAKRQFTELFGQYVPPELVDEMARNPENYSMEGRKAELTVLFSDVRGFTTISEGLQPDQLATLMNLYLGAMTEVIRGHRGTLDKYIGDAIMAFWGAPVADAEHAKRAVTSAIDMQAALVELNKDLLAKGWPELKIGVGVNTGTMTVGDMGSPVRKAYTVMGDAVNLGSRLEGITKQYGVGIIVGEGTRDLIKKDFVFRELDLVRVKGKDKPVGIFEPLGAEGQVPKQVLEENKLWHQALRAYRAQDWDQAEVALFNLSRAAPHKLYEVYMERVAHYRKDPPGPDWDGAWKFETK